MINVARKWPAWPANGPRGPQMARVARKWPDWRESGAIQFETKCTASGCQKTRRIAPAA
jgi:hypothetical protein